MNVLTTEQTLDSPILMNMDEQNPPGEYTQLALMPLMRITAIIREKLLSSPNSPESRRK